MRSASSPAGRAPRPKSRYPRKLQPSTSSSGSPVCAASVTARVGNISSKKWVLKWPTPVQDQDIALVRRWRRAQHRARTVSEAPHVDKRDLMNEGFWFFVTHKLRSKRRSR